MLDLQCRSQITEGHVLRPFSYIYEDHRYRKGAQFKNISQQRRVYVWIILGPVLKIDIPSLGQRNYKFCFLDFSNLLWQLPSFYLQTAKYSLSFCYVPLICFLPLEHHILSPICIILFCIILELSTKLLVLDPYIKKKGLCFINVAIFFLEITYFTLYYYYYYCLKVSFHKIAKILHTHNKNKKRIIV